MSRLWLPGQPLDVPDPAPQTIDDELPLVLTGAQHDGVSAQLSFHDRKRLRVAAKQALLEAGCPPYAITDTEADKYIDALLRETAETMIKRAVDAKLA